MSGLKAVMSEFVNYKSKPCMIESVLLRDQTMVLVCPPKVLPKCFTFFKYTMSNLYSLHLKRSDPTVNTQTSLICKMCLMSAITDRVYLFCEKLLCKT